MKVQIDFEKRSQSGFLSIDYACELICLILGTRVEAVYNEDQSLSGMAMWGWDSGRDSERHEGINHTKGQRRSLCG